MIPFCEVGVNASQAGAHITSTPTRYPRGRSGPNARALCSVLNRLGVRVLEIRLLTGNHDVDIFDAAQAVN